MAPVDGAVARGRLQGRLSRAISWVPQEAGVCRSIAGSDNIYTQYCLKSDLIVSDTGYKVGLPMVQICLL